MRAERRKAAADPVKILILKPSSLGDVVQALISAAKCASAPGKVFNVGTGTSLTISGLWGMIAALSGSVAQPVNQPARPGDIPHSLSAIDSARAELGFLPRVSLESGLRLTLDWYRGNALK